MSMRNRGFHCLVAWAALLASQSGSHGQDRATLGPSSVNTAGAADKKTEPETSEPEPAEPSFGGTLWERPKLTGDWFGLRSCVAERGITLDTSLTQFYQGVTSGGRQQGWEYGGKLDYLLNINGEKVGLWKGLSFTMHTETRYGNDVNSLDGAILPTNLAMTFPRPDQDLTAITGLTITQSLSENVVVYFGKLNTLDDYQQTFAAGKGLNTFMNTSFVYNPIQALTIPYSTLGCGFAIQKDSESLFSFNLYNPEDTATTIAIDQLFARGVVMLAEARLPIKPRDLPGHQVFGGVWSSAAYAPTDRGSYFLNPGQGIQAQKTQGSWSLYYAFDQYLWVDPGNDKRGWGVFGNLGIADGNPNPTRWCASAGIGGTGALPNRPNDTFGIGYFYVGLSNDFKDLLSGPVLGPLLAQRDEHGVELFYNFSFTPWCHVTADLQIVEPSTRRLDTAVIAGVRVKLDF